MAAKATSKTNWAQVGIASVSQNFATGMAFGSFGTLVLAIEAEYNASRAQSSLLLSLLVVTLSMTAAFVGRKLERWRIRPLMITGALLGATGFAIASYVDGIYSLFAVYLFVLGPATAMFGVLPSMTLASRWTEPARQGLAMGLVNMPVMTMIVPLAIAGVLQAYGVRSAFRVLAVAELLIVAILLFVREHPASEAKTPVAAGLGKPDAAADDATVENQDTKAILRSTYFWLLVVGVGLVSGAGAMKLAHMIPLVMEQGRSFDQANLLLAVSGGSGLVGSFCFGWLADRVGGSRALILNALIQSGMWMIFLFPVPMSMLVADAVVVGACGGGAQAALGAAIVGLFGQRAFSNALGLLSLLTIPFLFGLSPLVSLIYDQTGNYHTPMAMMICGFFVAALALIIPARAERRSDAPLEQG